MTESGGGARHRGSPIAAGLACCCPRCGKGKLFSGYLTLAPNCPACGLDFSAADSDDGPAVFIILILGVLVVPMVFFVEFVLHPPYWVHLVLWPPVVLGLALALLRPFKGVMVAIQLHHRAGERF